MVSFHSFISLPEHIFHNLLENPHKTMVLLYGHHDVPITLWWTNSLLLKMAIEIVDFPINGDLMVIYWDWMGFTIWLWLT